MSVRSAPGATAAPGAANEFVGRTDEVGRIVSLLADPVRLLTVIGPGGIGKTRLVAEALSRLEGEPRPVYWVRLHRPARHADAGAIEDEIARVVVGADFSGRSVREAIADTLRASGRALPAVLVLDSCEHVLDGAAAMTAELLAALGELTVVATSRTQLGWVDEYLVPVAPMSRQQAVELGTIDGSARAAGELRVDCATEVARLIGGAATLRARLGVRLDSLGPFATETESAAETARTVLGHAGFATAEREGAALRPEFREVERMALGTLSMTRLPADHPVWRQRPSRWHELSAAEQHVAVLAAEGWTNTDIATRRGSSTRTVDVQVAAVLHKLMIGTRADIAAFVPAGYRDAVAAAAARRPRRSRRRAARPGAGQGIAPRTAER